MEKKCGCKGCRSCLFCEANHLNAAEQSPNTINEKLFATFHYDQQSHCCISRTKITNSKEEKIIGFDFPGVLVVPNFLSSNEEASLVEEIDSCQWKKSQSGRCKQDYGPKVNFKKQKIKLSTFKGLPPYISNVICKMKKLAFLNDFEIVEQCNLEYVPERGSQIEPHFDDDWLWGERLVTLNMLSDTWFTMTYPSSEMCSLRSYSSEEFDVSLISDINKSDMSDNKQLAFDLTKVKIPLQRRSLVVLYGPARHKWKHAIERNDITSRRICCTFRELSGLFLDGEKSNMGRELLEIASSFHGSVVL